MAGRVGTNNFATADWIVNGTGLYEGATHTTVAAALSDASSGDTIFIRPGTYTENLTLKAGVNIHAFNRDGENATVEIVGKCSASFAGSAVLTGLRLTTNVDYCLETTGASATVLKLDSCYINASDNGAINHSSSSSSSLIDLFNCGGTHGGNFAFITSTSAGGLALYRCIFTKGSLTTTNCTVTAGLITINNSDLSMLFTSSSTGYLNVNESTIGFANQTALTINGTGTASDVLNSTLTSGTASAISIGAGATATVRGNYINSSNASPISNSGTLNRESNFFPNGLAVGSDFPSSANLGMFRADQNSYTSVRVLNRNNTAAQTTTASRISLNMLTTASAATEGGIAMGNDLTDDVTGLGTLIQNRLALFTNENVDGITIRTKTSQTANNIDFRTRDGGATEEGQLVATVTQPGEWTYPLQPAFLAVAAAQANVTGDGTSYTVTFASSEVVDRNSDFASPTFTAPVTGLYQLNVTLIVSGIIAGHVGNIYLTTSNRNYLLSYLDLAAVDNGGSYRFSTSIMADMDAADTASVIIIGSGATKVIDIGATESYFSGFLLG